MVILLLYLILERLALVILLGVIIPSYSKYR